MARVRRPGEGRCSVSNHQTPLPCPFCAHERPLYDQMEGRENHGVECAECGASTKRFKTKKEAIDAWNMRNGRPEQAKGSA